MKTYTIREDLPKAAEILKNGGLVAVPTETVYGLAGNGLDDKSVKEIYEVKGRPSVKPLSLMVPDAAAMDKYCLDVPEQAKYLAEKFWPGPLTIVLKSRECVPEIVRAGGTTLGLRCPDHPMTLELLRLSGVPFAAPSANPSGQPSPKNAQTVREYFDGRIAGIVDGGECGLGRESTIIDMSAAPYKILRQGALDAEAISDALVENMCIIGITGTSGSGKTTALKAIEKLGGLVIDCDEVYRELTESGEQMLSELRLAFPDAFLSGSLDRRTLGGIVFNDANALEKLNGITHAHVCRRVSELLRRHAMSGGSLAAIDAIELFSSGADRLCRVTAGVVSDRQTQIERIMKRDGIDREYAASRLAAQKPESYFREHCTFIIENNGTEADFVEKCIRLFKEIM